MVLSPCLLPLRSCGIAREIARNPNLERQASSAVSPSSTRLSALLLLARRRGGIYRFGNLALLSLGAAAAIGGRHHGVALRMSSEAAVPPSPSLASKNDDGESATKTVSVIIKGKVQGVYYRDWTVNNAQQLGVNGWVRNLKDGSVEALFSGKSAAVTSLIEKCHEGPSAAKVSSVEVHPGKGDIPQGFERRK